MTIPSDFFPPREAKARVGVTERTTLGGFKNMENKPLAQVYSAALDSKVPGSAPKGGGLAGGLAKLLAAVEAGDLPEAVFHGCSAVRGHWAYTTGLNADQRLHVYLAYNGSLDAAKALHEAVLSGRSWILETHGGCSADVWSGVSGDKDFKLGSALSDTPARAWLIAILKALIAETGDDT